MLQAVAAGKPMYTEMNRRRKGYWPVFERQERPGNASSTQHLHIHQF